LAGTDRSGFLPVLVAVGALAVVGMVLLAGYAPLAPGGLAARLQEALRAPWVLPVALVLAVLALIPPLARLGRMLGRPKEAPQPDVVTVEGRPLIERVERSRNILRECPYVSREQIASTLLYMARKPEPDAIDIVDFLLLQAVGQRASDIHWEPGVDSVNVKFRIDGVLHPIVSLPRSIHPRVVSRLRVMSNLAIYKRDVPQDGRVRARIRDRFYEVRLSILPTLHAEKCVIRIFDSEELPFDLSRLGMRRDQLTRFRRLIMQPQGTIFFTGPTGSGKTTTIYSALREIAAAAQGTRNIVTIEDPIEHEIPELSQTQVRVERGLTFAAGLRTILRQDPDVIMVGEIRDRETAQIAIRAGMTGHLVFTTVHTDSASSVFNRLIEMGIEAFLLASSSSASIAQRLVRTLCPECKRPGIPPLSLLRQAGLSPEEPIEYQEPVGCAACSQIGYKGRQGIFELLIVDNVLRELIAGKVPSHELFEAARKQGMIPLLQDGIERVREGSTSLEEVLRVAM
jgi:type II secretory ATPase GspE/PulE/Tfp pilus assembly ATPase PilB-like protein